MVGEVCEYDELAGLFQKIDTVRITTSEGKGQVSSNSKSAKFHMKKKLKFRSSYGVTGKSFLVISNDFH